MLHRQEPRGGTRGDWGEDDVGAHGGAAAGFVEDELSQLVELGGMPHGEHLLVHGGSGDGEDAGGDDVADLAGGVDADYGVGAGVRHGGGGVTGRV